MLYLLYHFVSPTSLTWNNVFEIGSALYLIVCNNDNTLKILIYLTLLEIGPTLYSEHIRLYKRNVPRQFQQNIQPMFGLVPYEMY